MSRRAILQLVAAAAVLAPAGCTRAPPRVVDGHPVGVTRERFHGRWWQYYERGVSWSVGGQWREAVDDFRACLSQRHSDNRRARTYGMHFVQCFAHRELGAALVELGQLDEAERELRISQSQEPSAKAIYLLERIAAQRQGLAVIPTPAAPQDARLVLDDVAALPQGGTRVHGHAVGGIAYAIGGTGTKRELAVDREGGFVADLAPGESAAVGDHVVAPIAGPRPVVGPAPAPGSVTPPADAGTAPDHVVAALAPPSIEVDGPIDGQVLTEPVAWFRVRVAAAAGAAAVIARDERGGERGSMPIAGVAAAGMIAVRLEAGEQRIEIVVRDRSGREAVTARTLRSAPRPDQDQRLRAIALPVPLAAPVDSMPMHADDDHRFVTALNGDARFRLVDTRGDHLLSREMQLVDAGYVDRATAAKLGRQLSARYVVAATIKRGRDDIECFVRLIHAETGREVASADAYQPGIAGLGDDAFFRAVAARLRQAFPVLAAAVSAQGEREASLDAGRAHGVVERMRFHVLRADPDIVDPATKAVVLPGERHAVATYEVDHREHAAAHAVLVEGAAASGPAVSE